MGHSKRDVKANGDGGPSRKQQRLKLELPLPARPTLRGNVLSCGQGEVGQLGLGEDVMEKTRPAIVASVSDVVEISAGGMHSLCLTHKGEVYSFGCNDEGALGRDTTEEGSEFEPKRVDLPGPCLKISAGDSHSACLLSDGRVYAWGSFRDSHGNMGLTLDGNKRYPVEVLPTKRSVDIASGGDHLVILLNNGHVYTVGCAEQGQLGRVTTRSAGGETRRGKTELLHPAIVNFRSKPVMADAIWASTYCTFFKDHLTGNIYAFGLNNYCQLGIPNPGENLVRPVFQPEHTSFTDVKTIAGGQHHTLVLKADGKVHVIGRKEYGRLGLANVTEDAVTLTPVTALPTGSRVVEISCGETTSFAVTDTGDLYAWGMGSNQQLGTGSEDDVDTPVLIASKEVKGKRILKVSSGGQHSLFVVQDTTKEDATAKPTVVAAARKEKTSNEKAKPVAAAVTPAETTTDEQMVTEGAAKRVNGTDSTVSNGNGEPAVESQQQPVTNAGSAEDKKPASGGGGGGGGRGRKRKL